MKGRRSIVAVFAALGLLLAACGGGGGAADSPTGADGAATPQAEGNAAGSGELQTIIGGIGTDPGVFGQWIIARDKGFAEANGVDLQIRIFEQGGAAQDAMLAGEVEFGAPGQATVIPAGANGEGVVVAIVGMSEDSFGVAAIEDIQTPKDLEGRTVGRPQGTSVFFLGKFIEFHGLDESKIEILNVDAPSLVSALARGDIDAFFAFDPHVRTADLELDNVHVLERGGDNGLLVQRTPLTVSNELHEDPERVKALLRTIIDANDWLEDPANHDEAVEIIAAGFDVPAEDVEAALEINDYPVYFDQAMIDEFDEIASWMLEEGLIEQELDLDRFIDYSLLQEVAPDRVDVD